MLHKFQYINTKCSVFFIVWNKKYQLYQDIVNIMSRVTTRSPALKQNTTLSVNPRDKQFYTAAALRILSSFSRVKEVSYIKFSFHKLIKNKQVLDKKAKTISTLLNSLYLKKNKTNLYYGFKSLVDFDLRKMKKQNQQLGERKNTLKSKSAILVSLVYKRLEKKKLKQSLMQLIGSTRLTFKLSNYKIKHIVRIFSTLYSCKLRVGFDAINRSLIKNKKIRSSLLRISKLLNKKKQKCLTQSLFTIKIYGLKGQINQVPVAVKKEQNNKKTSRIKPMEVKPQVKVNNEEVKYKQLENNNNKLEEQLKRLKIKGEEQVANYKLQIEKLEAQHESLKFNNGILDEAIHDLQSEILQRQKKSRKGMPASQLWQKIYNNFLLFLTQNSQGFVQKQKVLEHLECPLAPLNIDVEGLKAQNAVLKQLLLEYQKFFQGAPLENTKQQIHLPYDVLISKNKFLYASIQTLIRQGLGTENEIKQLQLDLDNVSKHI